MKESQKIYLVALAFLALSIVFFHSSYEGWLSGLSAKKRITLIFVCGPAS